MFTSTVDIFRDRWFLALTVTLALAAVLLYSIRPELEESRPQVFDVGAKLPSGWGGTGAKARLVLAVRADCRFCVESSAFYSRLAEQCERNGVEMTVVTPDLPTVVRDTLLSAVDVEIIQLPTLEVRGTPAIVLSDSGSNVIASWLGKLTPALEERVLKAVAANGRKS